MAITDRMTGAELHVQFIHAGGTAVLSGDMNTFSASREQRVADATAGNDGAEVSLPTIKAFGATLEAFYIGTAGSATWGSADIGRSGTLIYSPKGTATGRPRGGFPATITRVNFSAPFDDVVKLTMEFRGQGGEVYNILKDVW